MALPTAVTPGYGYFYTVGPNPDVACNCLRRWLPQLQRMARKRGILGSTESLRVWQCTGGYYLSGGMTGVHSLGAAFDIGVPDRSVWDSTRRYKKPGPKTAALIYLAREMGAPPTWARIDVDGKFDGDPWENNEHIHGSIQCPHNARVAYQYREWLAGGDGLIGSGKDPHPRPSVIRTWEQGLKWADAQLYGTSTPSTPSTPTVTPEDDMLSPEAQAWIEARLDAHDQYVIASVRNSDTANALFAGHNIIKDLRAEDPNTAPRVTPSTALERATLATRVKRTEGDTTALQEIADTRTQVAAIAAEQASLRALLVDLKDAVAALPKA